MAGRDRKLDPITGDYIPDGRGGWQTTRTIQTAVHHQIHGERGRWAGDKDAGSEIHLLPKKNTESTMQRGADVIREALAVFEADGRATDVQVAVDRDQRGRQAFRASIRDTQSGEVVSSLIPFGV